MLTAIATVERIARTCYEANRAYCEAIGDHSFGPWDEAPGWQRTTNIDGVLFRLEHPDATPEDMHVSWLKAKEAAGWVYGETKDPDATPPTHPCIRPYAELPVEQRAKDHIFGAIVAALTYAPPATVQAEERTYPPVNFGHQIVVNTPGRPLNGVIRHAAVVTAIHGETICSAYVIPAGGQPFHLAGLERDDTIDRVNNPSKATWSFTS